MKLIYTNENRFLVSNIQNIIQNENIDVSLKNEYVAGGAGDLSPFDTWLELWVSEEDYEKALEIISSLNNSDNADDWFCSQCHEKNSSSFEICWQCQHERDS